MRSLPPYPHLESFISLRIHNANTKRQNHRDSTMRSLSFVLSPASDPNLRRIAVVLVGPSCTSQQENSFTGDHGNECVGLQVSSSYPSSLHRTLTSHRHSTLMNIPNGPLQNVVPNFNMAQFLRFRGVCRLFYQIVDTSERDIVRQLLNNPELWQAGRIFGDTGPEMGSYNYLFGL